MTPTDAVQDRSSDATGVESPPFAREVLIRPKEQAGACVGAGMFAQLSLQIDQALRRTLRSCDGEHVVHTDGHRYVEIDHAIAIRGVEPE